VLWRFSYPRFRQFRAQYIVLNTLGFATYVLYPADPPWLVSQRLHLLPTLYRPVFEVWGKLGVNTARAVVERGPEFGNLVSAVPSMHAAVSMFVCLFFWPRARPWVRVVMVLYVLAMATTLVYGAEHYVFDIVVGWTYAIVVILGTKLLRRRRGTTDANLPTEPGRRKRTAAPDVIAATS
jgi:membrane-associated phospholipid phosphatase